MLNGVPKCYWGQKLYGAVRVLWKSCMSCSSAKMDSCLIIPCQLVWHSLANITVHSCCIRWGQLFALNNENCLNMVSYCSRTIQRLIVIVVCKICCNIGAGRFWHILPTLHNTLRVITDCLYLFRTSSGFTIWNWKTLSTLVSLPLYIIWTRMNAAVIDCLPHRWEKCVDSAGEYVV